MAGSDLRGFVGFAAWALGAMTFAGHGCAFSELAVSKCGGFLDDASAECRSCSEAACCAESHACRDSAACSALYDCIDACAGDPDCKAACGAAHPADQAAAELARCEVELCPSCKSCGGYYQLGSPTCDDCTREYCCTYSDACLSDAECLARAQCVNACTAPHCDRQCETLHPLSAESQMHWDAFGVCLGGSCGVECAIGKQFDCVGSFEWPAPLEDEVSFTGWYHSGDIWHEGLDVAACARLDLDCENPLAEGVTDDEGVVTLTIPVGDGFDGYFQVSGNEVALPLIQQQTAPLYNDEFRGFDMTSREAFAAAAALLGFEVDPDAGLLFAFPEDCINQRAPGIELVIEGANLTDVVPFYFDKQLPSTSLTETVPGFGGGGWGNVPPGLYTVRAIRAATGEEVGLVQLISRAGTVTSTTLSPKP